MSLNLSTMCRLCLSEEGTTYIFQDIIIHKGFVALSKSITACVAIEVLEGDGLPTLICFLCLQQIEKFSLFREICSNSDATLRQYLRDLISDTADTNQKFVETSAPVSLYNVTDVVHQFDNEEEKDKLGIYREHSTGRCTDSFPITVENALQNDLTLESINTCGIDKTLKDAHPSFTTARKEQSGILSGIEKHLNCEVDVQSENLPQESQNGEETGVKDETVAKLDLLSNSSTADLNVNSCYICQVCSKTFTKKVYLKRHEVIHSGKKSYSCKQCGSSFFRTGDLAKHIKTHPPPKQSSITNGLKGPNLTRGNIPTCPICSREFTKPYYLKQHEVVHYSTNKTTFLCEQCGKPFQNSAALMQHKIIHTDDKKYSCTICLKEFARTGRLKNHMRLHNGNKQFLCNVCGKPCGTKDGLVNHERTHSGDKPFLCGLCDKRFTSSSNYRTHMKHHIQGKRFVCANCNMSFFTKSGLERHERLHSGYKPFPCEVCDVSFYTKREMLRHKAYHLGNKRFSCDRCNKSYFESQHLVIHQRSHSGERPFSCGQCEKSFSDGSKLNRHKQTHQKLKTQKN